ncbi:hypothetical protein MMC14_004457 [Varicellaria rhodocarpa]|nr:hypothetical protein [Varicellaria rhodocarpa]
MITDNDLYTLAIFLGSLSMLLIVLYHFLEVNAQDDTHSGSKSNLSSDKNSAIMPEKKGKTTEADPAPVQQGGIKGKEKGTVR